MPSDLFEPRENIKWLIKLRWIGCLGVIAVTHIARSAKIRFSFSSVPNCWHVYVMCYNQIHEESLQETQKP